MKCVLLVCVVSSAGVWAWAPRIRQAGQSGIDFRQNILVAQPRQPSIPQDSSVLTTRSTWSRPSSRPSSRLSMSTISPPRNPNTRTRTGGGGEGDGLHQIEPEDCRTRVHRMRQKAHLKHWLVPDMEDHMNLLDKFERWADEIESGTTKPGTKRMTFRHTVQSQLQCLLGVEVVWRGFPEHDVRMVVRLMTWWPLYDKRECGFNTLDALKELCKENAMLMDLEPFHQIPPLKVFTLHSLKFLTADPGSEQAGPMGKYKKIKRSTFVVDDLPMWADIGPYWYEGVLPEDVHFFFRKRFQKVNEFEVAFDRPDAGGSTGSGTVGGARIITMLELHQIKDVPGHSKLKHIESQLVKKLQLEIASG